MSVYLNDGDVQLYHGDALEVLREMPSESVHCIVTSPPFWGLRSYIDDAHADKPLEHGLEDTPEAWCDRLVGVFREARRVLRNDGVCWIEVGDTYTSSGTGPQGTSTLTRHGDNGRSPYLDNQGPPVPRNVPPNIKPKDLVGAPWLLAFALRADGWYLRSDTIWARPNPMPESVTDRPTKAHSYVFLLSKQARYYFDADSIREAHVTADDPRNREDYDPSRGTFVGGGINDGRTRTSGASTWPAAGRNARSVWNIPTEPTPFAHFATFPQALVERCIKAGTSEHGACSACGAPWRRITEYDPGDRGEAELRPKRAGGQKGTGTSSSLSMSGNGSAQWAERGPKRETLGWEQSCSCIEGYSGDGFGDDDQFVVPATVLDPFMGSGTTALVARRLGRHAIGIELNLEYLAIAAKRLEQLSLFASTEARSGPTTANSQES